MLSHNPTVKNEMTEQTVNIIGMSLKKEEGQLLIENKVVAKQGGTIAGDARKALELKTGEKVVSENNYLPESKKNKRIKNGNNE